MATPKQRILANLVPSPLNVKSSKPSTSTPSQKPSTSAQSTDGQWKRHLLSNRHDTSLSGRARKKIRQEQDAAYLEHPYTLKLRTRKAKLQEMLLKIFKLADNNILVCDRETGLNDYTKNEKFADELDDIAKHLVGLSQECTTKAARIHERIADAKEDKHQLQDIVHIQDVIKESEKDDHIKLHQKSPTRFVKTSEFQVKRKRVFFVDDPGADEEELLWDTNIKYSGDPDTKFAYPKDNDNDELHHVDHICIECDKTLRDSQELRNHLSNHHKEMFRCLVCNKSFWTEAAFEKHYKTHNGERFTCVVCATVFDMKSTLTNHMFSHTEERMTCNKCGRQFKIRSSYLEHIKYLHLRTKTIKCPVCHKYFWTPTAMRSHHNKKHGSVNELVYGEKKD